MRDGRRPAGDPPSPPGGAARAAAGGGTAVRAPWRRTPVERFLRLARRRAAGAGGSGTRRYLFGGLEVWLRPLAAAPDTAVELVWVGALRPGHGEGGAGMRALAALADRAGVALRLHADPWGRRGRMSRGDLRRWYERFGFEAATDALEAYWPGRLGLAMRRAPRRRHGRTPLA